MNKERIEAFLTDDSTVISAVLACRGNPRSVKGFKRQNELLKQVLIYVCQRMAVLKETLDQKSRKKGENWPEDEVDGDIYL